MGIEWNHAPSTTVTIYTQGDDIEDLSNGSLTDTELEHEVAVAIGADTATVYYGDRAAMLALLERVLAKLKNL